MLVTVQEGFRKYIYFWMHRNGDQMEGYQRGEVRMRETVQRLRSIIGRYKIDGEVENSVGNGGDKELICTTHGHELRGRECRWKGGAGQR